jgi:hypothetical protein
MNHTARFLRLHVRLLWHLAVLDGVLLVPALGYFLLPLTDLDFELKDTTYLFLFVLAVTAVHVRLLRSNCGGAVYYLMLPVRRLPILLASMALFLVPFACCASVLAIAAARMVPSPPGQLSYLPWWIRVGHVLYIYVCTKMLAIPTLLLWDKPAPYLLAFFTAFIPAAFLALFMQELFFAQSVHATILTALCFLGLSSLICLHTVRRARL